MKNLPLLLGTAALSLASFFAAVSAEPSVYRYSALKRDKTDYAAIAAGCPNKAITTRTCKRRHTANKICNARATHYACFRGKTR